MKRKRCSLVDIIEELLEEKDKVRKLEHDLNLVGGQDCYNLLREGLASAPSPSPSPSAAAAAAEAALNSVVDLAWEKLHTGHWKDVDVAWRDAYALAQLAYASRQEGGESLKRLDRALLLGGPLFRKEIFKAVDSLALLHVDGGVGDDENRAKDRVRAVSTYPPQFSLVPPLPSSPSPSKSSPADVRTQRHCHLVETTSLPSLEEFLVKYFLPEEPVVIKGGIDHWRAFGKWGDLNYLKDLAGDRTIPVELGRDYLHDPNWGQKLMTLREFVDEFVCENEAGEEEKKKKKKKKIGYLAQHELFSQLPFLRDDIVVPDFVNLGQGELVATNAWFGPANTTSPFHYDPHHNLLAQVIGHKYLRIASPSQSACLYPYKEGLNKNSSSVNVDEPDVRGLHPLYKNLEFKECFLEPGDMLYLPPKWWHFVRSLSISFSVSFWWS